MNKRFSILNLSGDLVKIIPFQTNEAQPSKVKPLADGNQVIEIRKLSFNNPERPEECILELYSSDFKPIKTVYKTEIRKIKWIRKERVSFQVIQPFSPDFFWDVSPDGKIIAGFSNEYKILLIDPLRGR